MMAIDDADAVVSFRTFLWLHGKPTEGVDFGRVAVAFVGLILKALVDLVVVIDHSKLLLAVVLAEVGLGDVLLVDKVVDFELVARLYLDAHHENERLAASKAGVEPAVPVEERDEVDRDVAVDLVLLPEAALLVELLLLVVAEALQPHLLLLFVLVLVLVLAREDLHHDLVEHEVQDLRALLLGERDPLEARLLLQVVIDADVVDAARAVEVAHHLPLDVVSLLRLLPRGAPAREGRQLAAEVLRERLDVPSEALLLEVQVAAEPHLLLLQVLHDAAVRLLHLQPQPREHALLEAAR